MHIKSSKILIHLFLEQYTFISLQILSQYNEEKISTKTTP